MKTTFRFALVAAALSIVPAVATAEVDCLNLAASVKIAVAEKPAEVLQIVEKEVSANSSCACEVVKAAIEASKADAKAVAAIVETAASVAPDKMRLVSQCAVAVAPEALADVQSVLSRLDPNRGESGYSSKGTAKGAKDVAVKPAWNPLDFPGQGPVGPTPGGPPTFNPIPPGLPPGIPGVIDGPDGSPIDRPIKTLK
ncbi:hypothetical protein OKA04_09170 [Luteolibacter flavescens]|uniref:Uncharacterized protein n=1 Tax=Luteolibacter flavescens TaxID=1859460 RepID=A0ABT3FMV1_9BACT|nr:hypothetical protein [Luteolibacter flavescens]MCW1884896.1 hypothetical protein [Luteolibacter flavescens]